MSARRLSIAGLVGLEELAAAPPTPGAPGTISSLPTLASDADQIVVQLPVKSIRPNRYQPRRSFNAKALQELADSIAAHGGVLQPILVRPAEGRADSGEVGFELVAGERRWRASELAGMTTIRAIVDGVDNATSAQMALTENMARDDLNPIEEARGCAALRDDFGMSLAEIGRRAGRGDTAISHLIRLLKLPDSVLELIACGNLSEGHGRVLLSLPDHGDQARFGKRCAAEGWSVRALERQIKAHKEPAPPRIGSSADQVEWLRDLRESLERTCGASPVSILARAHDRYQIVVDCHGSDELVAIVARLRHEEDATTPTRSTDS